MTVNEKINTGTYEPTIKFSEDKQGYKQQQRDLQQQFKIDLLIELGFECATPGSDLLYNMAWERGHTTGLQNVVHEAEELADLVFVFNQETTLKLKVPSLNQIVMINSGKYTIDYRGMKADAKEYLGDGKIRVICDDCEQIWDWKLEGVVCTLDGETK